MKITIDGIITECTASETILQVARKLEIDIPNLCYLDGLDAIGACRLCVVEIEGRPQPVTACSTTCADGMVVKTNTKAIREIRKTILGLLISSGDHDCFSCDKIGVCQLQDYCAEYGVEKTDFPSQMPALPKLQREPNPFYYYNPQLCIMCQRCVQVCQSLQCSDALTVADRGFDSNLFFGYSNDIEKTECVSCGNCVSNCPTNALAPKQKVLHRKKDVKKVLTTCPYCGVGCQMYLHVKGNKVVGVDPANGAANTNLLCVKGKFAYNFINHEDRLTTPLIKKNGTFEKATWEEAYKLIASKINEYKKSFGVDSIAGLASARVTNEENYVFQKMMRAAIGTNNVDHCARLCHASTVAGLATTLGSGAMTNSISEVALQDVIFVTGSNTTETHPVIGAKIKQAVKKGAKLIVAEPRRIELAQKADVFLQIKPGTNVALLNGMMNVIISENLHDKEFIKTRTENYEELEKMIKEYTPERVAEICCIDAEDLKKAARMYAKANKAGIFYSMGVTQHSTGVNGVMSVSNLALVAGKLGKEGCGVNPLRGQNNVQGACDMGALPGDYTGYQKVANDEARAKFEKAWGVTLPPKPGLTVTEVTGGAAKGTIKMIYIMGENPMISDPDVNHVEKALNAVDFLVVQDIFLTETAALADVVLPACTYAEKEGTFTNTERRVQRVRAAIKPVGESKPDWLILKELMEVLGYKNTFNSAKEIMDEINAITPSYGGITYDRLETETLQWPCPTTDHKGTPILHKEKFTRGLGLFKPAEYTPSAELPDAEYPYILTTGRILYQYHTRSMTGREAGLTKISGDSFVQMNPETAAKFGVRDGDKVTVTTRRGSITIDAVVTDKVVPEVVFIPFHYFEGSANRLTVAAVDPVAKIPEFKVCACALAKA